MNVPAHHQKISECGQKLANACVPALGSGGQVHLPTVVMSVARMAGGYLFRSFRLALPDSLAPGEAVLSTEAAQHTPLLMNTCANVLETLGVTLAESPPPQADAPAAQARLTLLESQQALDPVFAAQQAAYGLDDRQTAQAGAVALAVLIRHFAKNIEPNRLFALAVYGFTEGARTRPMAAAAPGGAAPSP